MPTLKEIREIDWKKCIQCPNCKERKEMTTEFFCIDRGSPLWFMYKCKVCRHNTEKESNRRSYRKNRDKYIESMREYREKNKDKLNANKRAKRHIYREVRKDYLNKNRDSINEKNRNRGKAKWYRYIHVKTSKFIRKLWIRPDKCAICWNEWVIVAHHPDYNKWNEIVFCCVSCHRNIHNWVLSVDKNKILTLNK